TLEDVIFYQAVIAPPARRNAGDAQVLRGQRAFAQAQCATCHRPSYVTGEGPFPRLTSKALSNQTIHPYTDLLLHDMGEALVDNRPDFQASGRQWKTPPLWGIGLLKDVNGHTRLIHDGRANGVLEAILWHGGEAQGARDSVLRMSREEREALVKFVESL
ncbi:MAG: di-heme oxidoredictase family protein, partial [Burkholderiaceae bacterium]